MARLPRRAVLGASAFALAISGLAILGLGRQSGGSPSAGANLTLPVVAGAGILDGFNPCSFAGLILFASFTMAAARTGAERSGLAPLSAGRLRLLGNGLTYISAIFLVYLVLGLGFLAVVNALSSSHVVGKVAAIVTVALGLWTLKDAFLPEWGWRLQVPRFLRPRMQEAFRATTPVAVFAGG